MVAVLGICRRASEPITRCPGDGGSGLVGFIPDEEEPSSAVDLAGSVERFGLEHNCEGCAELSGHVGPPHQASAGVGDLSHVDGPCDGPVAMAEEERHLINALAGEQCARRNCVPE